LDLDQECTDTNLLTGQLQRIIQIECTIQQYHRCLVAEASVYFQDATSMLNVVSYNKGLLLEYLLFHWRHHV